MRLIVALAAAGLLLSGCGAIPGIKEEKRVAQPKAATPVTLKLVRPASACKTWVDADRLDKLAKAGKEAQFKKMLTSDRCTVLPAGTSFIITQGQTPYSEITFLGKGGKRLYGWVPVNLLTSKK